MMRIYDYAGFPNPIRVRIAIQEKALGDQVEFVSVDVPNGEHKKPPFLALNPAGTVPVLELEDGTVLAECTAITEYLDQLDGEPDLTGRGAKERATIHMMQRRVEAGVLDAVAGYFHQATPGLGPEIEGEQIPAWGERQRQRAIEGMRFIDTILENQDYVAGSRFSVADITLLAGLIFADFAKVPISGELKNLVAWRTHIMQRPTVQAVLNG